MAQPEGRDGAARRAGPQPTEAAPGAVPVGLLRLPGHDAALPLPAYETAGAAGFDLRACLAPEQRAAGLTLAPMARAAIPTGLALAIPPGWEVQVRPRSGLALRLGLTVANAPGTVDCVQQTIVERLGFRTSSI